MERISIFNYEIFYLDYLEGRLDEEDVAMLKQFFIEHPECELEDQDLPVLSFEDAPVYKGKSNLKQTEDSEAITTDNVEFFMISDAEGLLPSEKSIELGQFVDGNANLEKDNARYKAVYFVADPEIVFQNKESLKRKKGFVLWPYASAAMAAAIISFVFFMNGDGSNSSGTLTTPVAVAPKFLIPNMMDLTIRLGKRQVVFEENPEKFQTAINYKPQGPNKPQKEVFEPMAHRKAHNMASSFDKQLAPVTLDYDPTPIQYKVNPPAPIYVDNRMKNPIEPVTNFIATKTNKDIDLGTRKATSTEKGGFFFKIGKFEISRNKH